MNTKILFAFLCATFIAEVQNGAMASQFNFNLTKGKGVPVCEAYLKRLNNSNFDNAPFCGRPEDDSIPGFTRLNRVSLTAEEIHDLYPKMDGFQSSKNQNKWLVQLKDYPDKEFMPLASVRDDIRMNRLGAWRYDTQVDIDNDGRPDNILMWYQGRFGCGSIDGHATYPAHGSYTANILDTNNKFIDQARTKELFGHPKEWLGKKYPNFRYVGTTMGIFTYQGEYYFDTFLDPERGDYEGLRRKTEKMAWTLAVFLRKGGKTKQICEYYWTNWKDLEMGRNTK